MTTDPPKHVVDEFEKDLDDHIQHVSDHLDKKEHEHKEREQLLPKTGV